MNVLLLHPSDVLFFRDGRPMGGASSGHGAAWPLPTVISHAFHAALHRAEFSGIHKHVPGRSSSSRDYSAREREENGRLFGGLTTAGPFPVRCGAASAPEWFFPRPADAVTPGAPVLLPVQGSGHSSLPAPLRYAVGSTLPPDKAQPGNWWSLAAWQAYLNPARSAPPASEGAVLRDTDVTTTEHTFGIGLSADTGSVEDGRFYSAHYLRLRPDWALGVLTRAWDKDLQQDLVLKLLSESGKQIIAGGQQRVCTAERLESTPLPLPTAAVMNGTRVKWILLTPAIFPAIDGHAGGWLPSWVDRHGQVQLLDGPGKNAAKRRNLKPGEPIKARLVAAVTGKPVPVTGYALPNPVDPERQEGGAKSTHLAVPAGSVYYFEAESPADAEKLAAALNWHGSEPAATTTIKNRRSTLMGEKGFGLGVCTSWEFLPPTHPIPSV